MRDFEVTLCPDVLSEDMDNWISLGRYKSYDAAMKLAARILEEQDAQPEVGIAVECRGHLLWYNGDKDNLVERPTPKGRHTDDAKPAPPGVSLRLITNDGPDDAA